MRKGWKGLTVRNPRISSGRILYLQSIADRSLVLSPLNRIRPPQGDVEVADGGDQHGEEGEAVDARAEEEGGHEVALDQADDAVEGPERGEQGDQRDGPRRVPGAQRSEEGHAAGADEDHEAEELAAELAVGKDDQVRAEEDADHQEEDRPQAVGDGRTAAREADGRV